MKCGLPFRTSTTDLTAVSKAAVGTDANDDDILELIINSTDASSGAQQYSPILALEGQGFESTAAITNEVQFGLQVRPVENNDRASGELHVIKNIKDEGFLSVFRVGELTPSTTPSTNPSITIGDANVAYSGTASCNFATNTRTGSIILDQSAGRLTLSSTNGPKTLGNLLCDQTSGTGAVTPLSLDQADLDQGFIDFLGTASADALSPISTLTTAGATTHFIRIEINGVNAWIAASTTDPS